MEKMNVRCSIKQFGCSLDPFKTLAHLDVYMVKIDGSFAADIQQKNEKPDTLKELIQKLNEARKSSIVPLVENASCLPHCGNQARITFREIMYKRPVKKWTLFFLKSDANPTTIKIITRATLSAR
jgi:predicted signal transduction protein with EAL and GGDEF domain